MKTTIEIQEYFKENKRIFLYLLVHLLTVILYGFFTSRTFSTVHDIEIGFDSMIPFLPRFIYIYNTYALLALGFGIYLLLANIELCKRYYSSLIIARVIAYIVFVLYSTDVATIQPDVMGDDLTSRFVRLIYECDTTINTFPSLHTSAMTIVILSTINSNLVKYNKLWIIALSATIIATTVLVKQHVFLDIIGGLIIGGFSYYLGILFVKKYEKPSKIKSLL